MTVSASPGEDEMNRIGRSGEVLLNLATVIALLLAAGLLLRDRVLPALEERRVVDPGEVVPGDLRMLDLRTGDTVELAALAPVTSLAFLSSCPSCARSATAWRDALLTSGSDTNGFVAIAIREEPGTRNWLKRKLPGTRAFRPVDAGRFTTLLRIEVVPTVLAIGRNGRLVERRPGVIPPAEAVAMLRESTARAPGTAE